MAEAEYQAICPHCKCGLEIHTPLRGTPPEEGWVNVCMECAGISVVHAALERLNPPPMGDVFLRLADASEYEAAMEVVGLRLAREAALERTRWAAGA